ncbi:MAG: hypothetical protein JSS91_04180 [Bacteroidetes bacterium]|nr:hypothetical protein [Bacteroidota bacterium]
MRKENKTNKSLRSFIRNLKYKNLLDFRLKYPESKFLIYTRGRTGSTLLTELLNCHPDIFCDREIFNFLYSGSRIRFPELYIDSCSKRASYNRKKVYGFKVKIAQLRYEHKYENYQDILDSLHEKGWKFIYLRRKNYLRHKLSNIISYQTNIFHLKYGDRDFDQKIKVDCEKLFEGIKYGEEVEKTEQENLKNIPHLTVTYEDDLLEREKFQNTADRAFSFLGLDSHPVKSDLKRIVKLDLKEVILNYSEVEDFLIKKNYDKFLK